MSTATEDLKLVATYSALGTRDGDEYFRGDECLGKCALSKFCKRHYCHTSPSACIKDLIRALRSDNDQCEVRIHLGKAQVLQKVSKCCSEIVGVTKVFTFISPH